MKLAFISNNDFFYDVLPRQLPKEWTVHTYYLWKQFHVENPVTDVILYDLPEELTIEKEFWAYLNMPSRSPVVLLVYQNSKHLELFESTLRVEGLADISCGKLNLVEMIKSAKIGTHYKCISRPNQDKGQNGSLDFTEEEWELIYWATKNLTPNDIAIIKHKSKRSIQRLHKSVMDKLNVKTEFAALKKIMELFPNKF